MDHSLPLGQPHKGDPRTIIFNLLGGFKSLFEKENLAEEKPPHLWYLVSHTQLHVEDIHCIKVADITYLFLPAGTPISEEDKSYLGVRNFELNSYGYDIYVSK